MKTEIWFWVRVDRKCTQIKKVKVAFFEEIVSKVKEIVENDASYTVHDIWHEGSRN